MSMFDDVLGLGRSSVTESMMEDTLEPEIAGMTLEEAADIDEDPMEYMLRVAYENEMNMMNLDAAIVAEEYIYLRENGEEMVTEAGKIQSVLDKAKQMIMNLWNKIQSFFKSIMKKIEDALKLDQRFLDKYEKKAAKYNAKVKGNKALLYPDTFSGIAVDMLDGLADLGTSVYDRIRRPENAKNTSVKVVDRMIMAALGGKDGDADTPKAIMKKMLKDEKDESKIIDVKGSEAIAGFKASKKAKEALKKAYSSNKKGINNQIKTVKKMESVAKKFKVIPTEESKYIHVTVKSLNRIGTYMTVVNRTFVTLINRSRSFCKAAIINAAAKDGGKDAPTNMESVSLIESFDLM